MKSANVCKYCDGVGIVEHNDDKDILCEGCDGTGGVPGHDEEE